MSTEATLYILSEQFPEDIMFHDPLLSPYIEEWEYVDLPSNADEDSFDSHMRGAVELVLFPAWQGASEEITRELIARIRQVAQKHPGYDEKQFIQVEQWFIARQGKRVTRRVF